MDPLRPTLQRLNDQPPVPFPEPQTTRRTPVLRFQCHPTAHAVRRSLVLIVFIAFLIFSFYTRGINFLFFSIFFFTNWGFYLTFIYFILVLFAEPWLLAHPKIENFVFLLVTQQFVISFIYWVVLAQFAEINSWERWIVLVFPHVFPVVSLLVDFFLFDIRIQEADFKSCFIVGLVYSGINLTGRLIAGKTLYPLLTWTDWNSVLFLVSGFLYTYIFGHLVMWLQEWKWVHLEEGLVE